MAPKIATKWKNTVSNSASISEASTTAMGLPVEGERRRFIDLDFKNLTYLN